MSEQFLRTSTAAHSLSQRAAPALIALLLGSFLLLGVGFASPDTIHNAAHDGRHAFAFPCH
jgi:cobalt transporter subunit CbtB